MEDSKIKVLLKKYYSGESTLEEEDFLKSYFSKKDGEPLLSFYAKKVKEEIDLDMESFTVDRPRLIKWMIPLTIATSVVFLLTTIGLFNLFENNQKENLVTVNGVSIADETIAKEHTERAFNMINNQFKFAKNKLKTVN